MKKKFIFTGLLLFSYLILTAQQFEAKFQTPLPDSLTHSVALGRSGQ